MVAIPPRTQGLWAIFCLAVAPVFLLGACLFGDRVFMPFDLAQYPPVSLELTAAEQAKLDAQPGFMDISEIPVLVEPETRLAHAELTENRFPHWNPYARFGAPLFANSLAAFAYPPNWLALISADPAHGYALGAYLSFLIAGLLMYGFLRQLQLRRSSALLGALVFAYSGTMTVNAHFYMRMNALIWLPGMFWACLRIDHTDSYERIPASIGLAFCVAMSWLAGFPPFAATCTLMAGCYALILIVREWRRSGARTTLPLATWLAGSASLGLALAAVQFLPLLEFVPESNRSIPPGPNGIAVQGFDPAGLLGYIMPRFFAEPSAFANGYGWAPWVHYFFSQKSWVADTATGAAAGTPLLSGTFNFVEYAVFVGTLTLPLALLGVAHTGYRLRYQILAVGLGFALIAMAPSLLSPLYALPGLKNIPPLRFMAPISTLLASFAAIGFDSLLHYAPLDRVRRVCVVTASCGGLLLLAAVWASLGDPPSESVDLLGSVADKYVPTFPQRDRAGLLANATQMFGSYAEAALPGSTTGLAVADRLLISSLWRGAIGLLLAAGWLVVLDRVFRARKIPAKATVITATLVAIACELLWFGSHWTEGRELVRLLDTDVHAFLREKRDVHRGSGGITIARVSPRAKIAEDLPTGTLFPERIRDLNSYAFVDAYSHLPFKELLGAGRMNNVFWPMAFPDDELLARPFFDLIGLRYLLATEACKYAGVRTGPIVKSDRGEFYIYERENPMARAFVVPSLEVGLNNQEIIRRLVAPDLEPSRYALVTPDVAERLAKAEPGAVENPSPRTITFIRDDPAEIVIHVDPGEQPGYVVLADTYMAGWSATVSGAPVTIERANLFMRIVPVPAIGVEIRYTYETPGLTRGFTITLLAFGVVLFLGMSLLSSRRRNRRAED